MNVRNRPRTCKTDSIHPWFDQPILIHNSDCLYMTFVCFSEKNYVVIYVTDKSGYNRMFEMLSKFSLKKENIRKDYTLS